MRQVGWWCSLLRGSLRCLAILCLAVATPVLAAPPGASEEAVKAAYVYNFIKFTTWPDEAFEDETSLTICTDANDELSAALHSLEGRKAGTRTIAVHDLPEQGLDGCQVALLDRVENAARCDTERPVLTISTFDRSGAVIRLFLDGNKLRFTVDRSAARRSTIKLSAKLLAVAAEVID